MCSVMGLDGVEGNRLGHAIQGGIKKAYAVACTVSQSLFKWLGKRPDGIQAELPNSPAGDSSRRFVH